MIKKICAICTAAMLVSSAAIAANKDDQPSEVNADAIEYDMNTGVITAEGNILLKHGTTRATGLHALFNVKTKEAHLIGNVIVVDEDMRITCGALMSNGQGHMVADENVIAVQTVPPNEKYPVGDTRTFTGEHIDYFPEDRKHVIIPTGGVAKSEVEGTFTADHMEGWIDDERYIGTGNAHLISQTRNLEAAGDQVDYDGKKEGKAVLSGNAWAIQDNNTIRGNRLTVYLADDGTLKAEPRIQMPSNFNEHFEQNTKPQVEKKSSDDTVVINPDEATNNET
ncbi:MAG: LPS export ABC transporter periplasmic protein LptC [Selenomonadaceae bacterium]|nr:LPS export ABC transporter periplasmic protein LptC [Selenomonadaceae bacterium]